MQRERNGGATVPAIDGRVVDFEFALTAETTDHVDFPPTSAAAISVREDGIGVPVVQRPVPWASTPAVSRAPASTAAAKGLHLGIFVSSAD